MGSVGRAGGGTLAAPSRRFSASGLRRPSAFGLPWASVAFCATAVSSFEGFVSSLVKWPSDRSGPKIASIFRRICGLMGMNTDGARRLSPAEQHERRRQVIRACKRKVNKGRITRDVGFKLLSEAQDHRPQP